MVSSLIFKPGPSPILRIRKRFRAGANLTAILHRGNTSTEFSTSRIRHILAFETSDPKQESPKVFSKTSYISYLAATHIAEEIGVGLCGLELID